MYVLSVVFVALGHCWPASPANAAPALAAAVSHSHDEAVAHGGHGQPDRISAEGCLGDETACAVAMSSPAMLPALVSLPDPISQSVVWPTPEMLVFAMPAGAFTSRGPPERRTHSLHSYAEAFARTGRLLI
ncbi:MAG: hypothetical protein KF769_15845 [Parvibaculum sp.]|nr:hypothetical protein [Parvibaculum sp.]